MGGHFELVYLPATCPDSSTASVATRVRQFAASCWQPWISPLKNSSTSSKLKLRPRAGPHHALRGLRRSRFMNGRRDRQCWTPLPKILDLASECYSENPVSLWPQFSRWLWEWEPIPLFSEPTKLGTFTGFMIMPH